MASFVVIELAKMLTFRARLDGLANRRRGCGFRRKRKLPITIFSEARAHDAMLAALEYGERRGALRARLRNRFVRRGEIAIGVTAASVEDSAASAALGCAAAHKFAFGAFGALDSEGNRARVLALRIF